MILNTHVSLFSQCRLEVESGKKGGGAILSIHDK